MSRKAKYGECRICGEYKKLTFEHVPPNMAFNNTKVKMIKGDELINSIGDKNRLPWEKADLKGPIQQKGKGDYYLCESCNNKTGSWYANHYVEFIRGIAYAIRGLDIADFTGNAVEIKALRVQTLPVFKQIMTMFCDINNARMGDDSLREFLLDKECKIFNTDKYKVYAYIHSGALERMNGIMAAYTPGIGIVMTSEISSYPLGFILYIDKPEGYKPQGTDITEFVNCDFDEKRDIDMILPILENNIIFSGDYRTQNEILADIAKNRKWEEEHAKELF